MNIFGSLFQSEIFIRLNFLLFSNLVLIPYAIRTFRNILHQTFLWQLKEYRWDRMKAHLWTDNGKKLLFGRLTSLKYLPLLWILILYSYFLSFSKEVTNPIVLLLFPILYFYLPILGYYLEGALNLIELIKRGWRMPLLTVKSCLIILMSLIIWIILSYRIYNLIMNIDNDLFFISLIIFDKILPFVVGLIIFLLRIPTLIYKVYLISKAKNKMTQTGGLTVIGITGSYGKTSTKEFLYQILSTRYKVLKTEGSTNTEIGVAKTIIDKLDKSHEIFIVEMGAYKKGEIAAICKIVKPDTGIITGINEQHISLFGTIENTMKAKYELIDSLRKGGKAFFNIGNSKVKEMYDWAKNEKLDLKTYTYQNQQSSDKNISFTATNVKVSPENLSFKLIFQKQSIICDTNLAGAQNIDNILAAAAVSFELGLPKSQIRQAIASLHAAEKTMQVIGEKGELLFVDDSFNANPDGVLSAVEYLKVYEGKKILILTPLIELGRQADMIHEKLGQMASDVADIIILTNSNYYESIIKKADKRKIKVLNSSQTVEMITNNQHNRGAVLFEGKEAGKVLIKLKNKFN